MNNNEIFNCNLYLEIYKIVMYKFALLFLINFQVFRDFSEVHFESKIT